jgi:uncharacterized protein with von Willebrand factor type A (vWA) domain
MQKNQSLPHLIRAWERLLSAVAAHADDLQFVEECRAKLEAEVADLWATRVRRDALQAEARKATQDLSLLRDRVEDLAARLRSGLRLHYGIRSKMLTEFGIKPIGPRAKKRLPAIVPGAASESHRTVK